MEHNTPGKKDGMESYDRFLSGDRSGMEELVERFRDGLILYINSLTGDLYESEDIAEDVFVELIVKRPVFRKNSSFRTWLYGIARHKALNTIRRKTRTKYVPDEILHSVPAEQADLEQLYFADEMKITVYRALAGLKYEYRQVLYLSYFENFSNSEIAAVMKKNNRQVENLLYRAKQAMKEELAKEGDPYEEL